MTIRPTESRIPVGFSPADLGESVQVDAAGTPKYALVSYLTSPVAQGSTIDYVVFVLGEKPEDAPKFSYHWTISHLPSTDKKEETTSKGIFRYEALATGELRVKVEVLRDGIVQATLPLVQEIGPLDAALEAFLNPTGMLKQLNVAASLGSLGGNPRTSRELVNNFRRYVFDAVGPPPKIDLPARYVAAILYAEILRVEKESFLGRDTELNAAGAELNGETSLMLGTQIDNALGVAQITPQTLAMIVGSTPSTTFTDWTELPAEEDKRQAEREAILQRLNGPLVAATVKVDLFNLLRFPKSNINMCARLLDKLLRRQRRWPLKNAAELIGTDSALAMGATEYKVGATKSLLPPAVGPPGPTDAKVSGAGSRVVQQLMQLPPLVLFFADATTNGASAYGGRTLQRNDSDAAHLWEGSVLTGPIPDDGLYVTALQRDLAELKFTLVAPANGVYGIFDRNVEWAVREFQIYAGMPSVAVETGAGTRYVDRLTQVPNVLRYNGPISGRLNPATRVALQYWKASKWRCPVVISAEKPTGQVFNGKENIWGYKEIQDCEPDVYARDFTGFYDVLPQVSQLIGMENELKGPISLHQNLCNHYRTHTIAPVTSDTLVGIPDSELAGTNLPPGSTLTPEMSHKRSTYKVVRSISEVESVGYFDSLNAWDSAIISIGMYHWTLGLGSSLSLAANGEMCSGSMCEGEMCAFLGLMKVVAPEAFQKYFGRFGIDVDRRWSSDAGNNGQAFFNKSLFKYAGWVRVQMEDGSFTDLVRQTSEANYFRNWHWFYRVTMASRESEAVRRLNWPFTRIRIRDLLSLPVRRAEVPSVIPGTAFRLRDLFTSEKAVAILLRAHVNIPRTICFNGQVSYDPSTADYKNRNIVPKALSQAVAITSLPAVPPATTPTTLQWSKPPAEWSHGEEAVLVKQLFDVAKASFDPGNVGDKAFDNAVNYKWQGLGLSANRNSFELYEDELPSAPSYEPPL